MPPQRKLETQQEWRARPRIYSTDDSEHGTIYHLYTNGSYVASAHWPHPLYEMEPTAVSGGDLGGGFNGCAGGAVQEDGLGFLDEWMHPPLVNPA